MGVFGPQPHQLYRKSTEALRELRSRIDDLAPESVAVNLLFSWMRPDLEKAIRSALPDDLPVSLSSEVLPEIREYERGIATWLNASVGPKLAGLVFKLAVTSPAKRPVSCQHTLARK